MHGFSICSVETDCISWIKTFSPQRDGELMDFCRGVVLYRFLGAL